MKNGTIIQKGYPKIMECWSYLDKTPGKALVLCQIYGAKYQFIAVNYDQLDKFKHNETFEVFAYQYARQLPIPKVEEMTVTEVCKELGREIKIIKG